ncbi:MAG: helix-hairpin-helix domain-containing protein [Spirochaetes bacterium]|nr:helix-hairpin-helix domain-containing protein [Spirochaetota bacterium]
MKIALLLIMARTAFCAFDYREAPPAALFPFMQAVGDASLPDSISNPAYLPHIRYPYLHVSGSMPYTLSDCYSTTLRAGYGTKGVGIRAVWCRTGIEEYAENTAEASLGYMPVRYVAAGASVRYYNLAINTVEVSRTIHLVDGECSLLISPARWIDLAFRQENIGSLFIKKRRDLLPPDWSAGAALKPFRGLTLAYNCVSTANGYVHCVSAAANVLKYFSVRVGYAREAGTFSAALSFVYKYMAASYGLKYHPHLGFTHSVGVTLAASAITIESLSYGDLFSRIRGRRTPVKTDINRCGMEALESIPGLDSAMAGRIMKYRNAIGPLSRKGLVQMGMSEREIDRLLEHATGLVPDETAAGNDYRVRALREKAQKALFKRLIALGLPPSTAIELSDMAALGQKKALTERINAMQWPDPGKKKQALELCAAPL